MNAKTVILNKLLDKYSRSKAFVTNTDFSRRVLLKCDKEDFPEYDYNDYETKTQYYNAVRELKKENVIDYTLRKGYEELIEEIWLNIQNAEAAYILANRESDIVKISAIMKLLEENLDNCQIEWGKNFIEESLQRFSIQKKLNSLWKNDYITITNLIKCIVNLPQDNSAGITVRAFSVKCYSNSKYFEREIIKLLIPIIKHFEPAIKELCNGGEELTDREVLSQVGIIMRNEIFEFCGDISVITESIPCDFSGLSGGASVTSTAINNIKSIVIGKTVKRVFFIENKTNYDEYILKEKKIDELVIYHGGFYGPQKAKFYNLLKNAMREETKCEFWADIDLGGFLMFNRLKLIFENVQPFMMGVEDFYKYKNSGLTHHESYYIRLEKLNDGRFSTFEDVIKCILKERLTVEQESML